MKEFFDMLDSEFSKFEKETRVSRFIVATIM